MPSSRMRTARLSTVSGGLHPGRGSTQTWGGSAQHWGVCIRGGLPNLGESASRGVCPTLGGLPNRGGLHPGGSAQSGGVCIQGGLPNPGGSAQPGGSASGGVGQAPSPVNKMTHRCKNITLPQTSFAASKNTPREGTRVSLHVMLRKNSGNITVSVLKVLSSWCRIL